MISTNIILQKLVEVKIVLNEYYYYKNTATFLRECTFFCRGVKLLKFDQVYKSTNIYF